MAVVARLETVLSMNTAKFTAGANKARSTMLALQRSVSSIGNAIGLTLTGGAIVSGLKRSVDAFAEEEMAVRKLEQALKATGGAAGYTSDEIRQMAASFQRTTSFSDDVTISAASVLASFTSIGRDVFPQAISAAQDLSTAFGRDLQSSIILVGKALNNPSQGMAALQKAGIRLTESQKQQIKALVEQNNLLGAQRLILDELNLRFGGQAAAAAETYTGQIERMKNAFGDLEEEVGKKLIPTLQRAAEYWTGMLSGGGDVKIPETTRLQQQIDANRAEQERIRKSLGYRFFGSDVFGSGHGDERIRSIDEENKSLEYLLRIAQQRDSSLTTQRNVLAALASGGKRPANAATFSLFGLGQLSGGGGGSDSNIVRRIFGVSSLKKFFDENFPANREADRPSGLPSAAVRGSAEAANIEAAVQGAFNPLQDIKRATMGTLDELKKIEQDLRNDKTPALNIA